VQLPADSAAAKFLGLPNLRPEISTSFSVGIVSHPLQDLSATVDAYSIVIGNRITASSEVYGLGGTPLIPSIVNPAIALAGVTLDPTVTQYGVTAFLNGYSTLTQGVDATINYPTDFGDKGLINWTMAGNFNETTVASVAPPPAPVLAASPTATFFNFNSTFGFAHSLPNWKIGLTADWSLDEYGATVRETYYGPSHQYQSPNGGGEYIPANQAGVILTDMELRYNVTDQLQFAFGGNNIFDIKPDVLGAAPATCGTGVIITPGGACTAGPNKASGQVLTNSNGSVYQGYAGTAFDPNGGYYYARVAFNF
jgi:iron complex outermembrane receptor protein